MSANNYRSRKSRIIILILVIVVINGIWFLFLRDDGISTSKASNLLVGEWIRTDGDYTIEINILEEDGVLSAFYFNPNPIHVGRSGWKVKDETLWIFVELQDENYPGSLYELGYDKENDMLKGTYYQAVARQTFNVEFTKK